MIAKFEHLGKMYCTSAGTFMSHERTSINLNKGEILVIAGKSACSQATWLTLMGCLVHPKDGIIEINGKKCTPSNVLDIALIQQQAIGFIFQKHNLLENLSAQENIAFPLRVQKIKSEEINSRTIEALKRVGLYDQRKKMFWQLTSLEKQQVAIAKALIIKPKIIVCDKPTVFLESHSGILIMKLLRDIANQGIAIAIVNHDKRYNDFADRAVEVQNGLVTELLLV